LSTENRGNIILRFLTRAPDPPKETLTAEKLRANPPYVKFAFANPYNLSLFTCALAASALTLNPILALATLGAEAVWLLHAPGSKTLQRLSWNKMLAALCAELEQRELEAKIASLGGPEQKRVSALLAAKEKIDQLAAQNPSFAGDLLRDELVKCDTLVRSFIDIATTCAISVNENADPDVTSDLTKALRALVPDVKFRHGEGNSDAHFLSMLIGTSLSWPYKKGRLVFGTWQGIYFIELDGPRKRKVTVYVNG